jgi:WD40 repeat protein
LHSPTEGIVKNIADVAWLPDGSGLVTVGGDLTLRLWDSATGELLATRHGHERPIVTVAISPDGRWAWSGAADGVRVWDLELLDPARTTWRIPRSAEETGDGAATAYDIAFDPAGDRAAVTTFEGWLRIMDVRSGRAVHGWRASDRPAVGVDWSPDGRWIASTDNDGRVVVWDPASGRRVTELLGAGRQLLNVAFNPDGSLLAAPAADSSLVVWRVGTWERIASLTEGGTVQDVVWADDTTLAATYSNGKVRIWDIAQANVRAVIDAGERGTPAIAFDPSRRRLAIALGRSVRIRDLEIDRWTAEWTPRSASARSIAWSADGERIAGALSGNMFEIWDARTGEAVLRLPQTATAWITTWTADDDLVLIPLDETIRILRTEERN